MWNLTETFPAQDQPLDALWQGLGETIAWCTARADLSKPFASLRSERLRPRIMQGSYAAAVWDVASKRRFGLKGPVAQRRDLAGGRILVYGPDEELSDGAAEAETGGFVDVNNCPPWDTWLALTQFSNGMGGRAAHLFAWVPPAFVPLVDQGIYVNPEECILWLEAWKALGEASIIAALRTAPRGLTSA
jgi:hypothetical protein